MGGLFTKVKNYEQLYAAHSSDESKAMDALFYKCAFQQFYFQDTLTAVSYTHLTLPTIYSV